VISNQLLVTRLDIDTSWKTSSITDQVFKIFAFFNCKRGTCVFCIN